MCARCSSLFAWHWSLAGPGGSSTQGSGWVLSGRLRAPPCNCLGVRSVCACVSWVGEGACACLLQPPELCATPSTRRSGHYYPLHPPTAKTPPARPSHPQYHSPAHLCRPHPPPQGRGRSGSTGGSSHGSSNGRSRVDVVAQPSPSYPSSSPSSRGGRTGSAAGSTSITTPRSHACQVGCDCPGGLLRLAG